MLVYGDVVTLENQFQTHSQASQCIPIEAATLGVGIPLSLVYTVSFSRCLKMG